MSLTGIRARLLAADLQHSEVVERLWPYLLLIILLAAVFAALAALGLDLGFIGDVLAYEYHYDRLGIQGGMSWLVHVEWQRHLLGALYSAPVHWLFPGQSAAWYGFAFLLHFANSVLCFLLVDTILRGQRRWLAFAAALIFAFDALQIPEHFEFPTGTHRKAALFLALLSLWFYLQWVRRERRNRWWRELSLASYAIAVASYEQTALFFLLHPVIAYFEDRPRIDGWFRWLAHVCLDSIWYPAFFVAYMFVLSELFPNSGQLSLSIGRIIEQMLAALGIYLGPSDFFGRLLPAFENGWLFLTLAVGAGMFVILWVWQAHRTESEWTKSFWRESRGEVALIALGLAMIAVSIAALAPTTWSLTTFPKLFYPAAVGFGMAVSGLLAWLLERVPNAAVRHGLFALAVAFLVGTGTTRLFQLQQEYIRQHEAREAVKAAILEAVPAWEGSALPYLLIVSDAHPSRDLALHAQDLKFPLMFDMLYGVDGIAADAIYPDVPASAAPPPDVPGSLYSGPYIVVEPEGIYSPLQPGIPIDPQRLVILYYDDQTQTAHILDELPPDVLATANIVERAPIEWRTNDDLIADVANEPARNLRG